MAKLWIDDLREDPDTRWRDICIPDGWVWVKTSADAIAALSDTPGFDEVAFDHDLGGADTTRQVMLWMIEHNVWPARISFHTANPVGREWLVGMARRYAPEGTVIAA